MDEIFETVKLLDTAQLRSKLLEIGIKVGPITPTTKSLFQKRLAKAIFEEKTGNVSASVDTADVDNASVESCSDSSKINTSSDVFFAVCLPEFVDQQLSKEGMDSAVIPEHTEALSHIIFVLLMFAFMSKLLIV